MQRVPAARVTPSPFPPLTQTPNTHTYCCRLFRRDQEHEVSVAPAAGPRLASIAPLTPAAPPRPTFTARATTPHFTQHTCQPTQ